MSQDTLAASRPAIPLLRLTLILGALTAFAPLTIDMYLPSFPTLAKALSTSPGRVQATPARRSMGPWPTVSVGGGRC